MKTNSSIVNASPALYDALTAERPHLDLVNAQEGWDTFTDEEYEAWPGFPVEMIIRNTGIDKAEFVSVFEEWGYKIFIDKGERYVTRDDAITFFKEQVEAATG